MNPVLLGGFGLAGAAALTYGLVFLQRPPSLPRTATKALFAASLAVTARLTDAPAFLGVGLALCAVGDACLAGDPKRWLPPGIVVFLLAHLMLSVLFVEIGDAHRLAEPLRAAGAGLALLWSGGLLALLWPRMGPLRPAGAAYAALLLATVVSALTLGANYGWAILGAVLFLASDSILAVRLFRHEGAPSRLWDNLVWWLYAGAVGLIAFAFLHG